ncbi:MAG: DUF1566 domain-containing protein [Campylobacterales bacterium]|jgi:hypothetical protein
MKIMLLIMAGLTLAYAEIQRDNVTGIVTDSATGLQWQDDKVNNQMPWKTAIEYCEALELGGFDDWRLPNLNALKSIVDRSKFTPAIVSGFDFTASQEYWSSTTNAHFPNNGWIVIFEDGYVDISNKSNYQYVRCVRGGW